MLVPCLMSYSSSEILYRVLSKYIIWGWMCVQWMRFGLHCSLHCMSTSGTQTSVAALIFSYFFCVRVWGSFCCCCLIVFNLLGWCFVRWQWRELPHTVQIFEEVTWGWERSNDNIGLHSSGDSSCVDTRQNGNAEKAPLCECECTRVCVLPLRMLQVGGTGCDTQSRQKLSHMEKKTK